MPDTPRTRAELQALFADTAAPGGTPKIMPQDDRDFLASLYLAAETDTLLAGKAASSHTHAESDITGLTAELDGIADTISDLADVDNAEAVARAAGDATNAAAITAEATARASAVTAEATARANADALLIPLTQKGASSGVASLDSGGKVPQSQLPLVAITNTSVVGSQAAMLALTAEEGDVAVRTDLNKSFILTATPASTLGNWQELLTPTDAVSSVAGKTGAVTLVESDITGLVADLASKAATSSLATVATTGAYSDLTGKPTLGTAAALNVPASGDAAAGEVVKGTDSRLSDARTPTTHTHTASQISDASANGRSLITAADYSAMRTLLALVPGTNVQAYHANLAALAGLTGAADSVPYFTGVGAMALMTVTSAARSVLDDTTTAAMLTTLGALALAGGTMTGTITSAVGTIAADTPAFNATQTWNNAAVTFTALKIAITDTASNSASKFVDFTRGGSSKFSVDVFGNVTSSSGFTGQNFDCTNNVRIKTGANEGLWLSNNNFVKWSSTAFFTSPDVGLYRNGVGVLEVNTATAGTYASIIAAKHLTAPSSANGQSLAIESLTELTTIAAAATTDTTIQIPAKAIVLGVSVRVTTAIPTAATFTVGDSGSAARYSTAAVSSAANSTDEGTAAGAYYNASALSVRITPNATPAANTGRVRVTIYFLRSTAPTS